MLNGKGILITGGTGSFGKKFVEMLIQRFPEIRRIVIYSRDEFKQFHMAQDYPTSKYPFMRYFLGDVRDKERLKRALHGIDVVIHTAALKQVPAAEYNPMEFIKTNVLGAENVIDACLSRGVEKIVALSTDKAAAPINLYGATKLCSDKLFVAANNIIGGHDMRFSVVRYGNVMGSRGSVIPFFIKKREEGYLPITSFEMTRFNILLEDAVELVFYALEKALGGELYVPKIPSYRITDLAKAIAPDCELRDVGIRPGEKIHEEMITVSDSLSTIDIGKYYAVIPQTNKKFMEKYLEHYSAHYVPTGFSYNSGNNQDWLTIDQIRQLIKNHLYPDFEW